VHVTNTLVLDLTVDIVDENGEELPNVDVDLRKTRIDNKGQEIETRNTGLGGEDRCMRCAISEGVLRLYVFLSLLFRKQHIFYLHLCLP